MEAPVAPSAEEPSKVLSAVQLDEDVAPKRFSKARMQQAPPLAPL